uniref:Sorting nexin 15 n=1 Tax=Nothobranchius kuhntae TaxID=321403 RepID=A0A1A8IBZ2_NOTKU
MSRKVSEDYYRFFTVTDPRTHEKGHTEYQVSARFVSKRHPEDVKEVVVWKRFSELKKLHGELAYTHRNLFRRQEDFPAFPRAQVFGTWSEDGYKQRTGFIQSCVRIRQKGCCLLLSVCRHRSCDISPSVVTKGEV